MQQKEKSLSNNFASLLWERLTSRDDGSRLKASPTKKPQKKLADRYTPAAVGQALEQLSEWRSDCDRDFRVGAASCRDHGRGGTPLPHLNPLPGFNGSADSLGSDDCRHQHMNRFIIVLTSSFGRKPESSCVLDTPVSRIWGRLFTSGMTVLFLGRPRFSCAWRCGQLP